MWFGVFEWIFWVLAFGCGVIALLRGEVLSTGSSQRVRRHAGQQIFLWIMTIAFALAGFVTAALALRAGF